VHLFDGFSPTPRSSTVPTTGFIYRFGLLCRPQLTALIFRGCAVVYSYTLHHITPRLRTALYYTIIYNIYICVCVCVSVCIHYITAGVYSYTACTALSISPRGGRCGVVYNVDWWPAVSYMCCSAAVVGLRLCSCVPSSERRCRCRCFRWVPPKPCVYIQGAREIGWKMVPRGTRDGDRPDELPAIKTRRGSLRVCLCVCVCVH